MDQMQKQALQVAKEIVVKFIEIGRISPNNFPEFFSSIYKEVLQTLAEGHVQEDTAESEKKSKQ